jgi:hypothetical protein
MPLRRKLGRMEEMNTRQRRGLLTAGMLTTAVLGGGLFAARAQESGFSAMAELAPQDSTAFVALDLRGSLELPDAVARLRATSISLPELGQVIHSLEDTLGSSLEQVSQWASPSAFVAVCPTVEYRLRLHPSAAD